VERIVVDKAYEEAPDDGWDEQAHKREKTKQDGEIELVERRIPDNGRLWCGQIKDSG